VSEVHKVSASPITESGSYLELSGDDDAGSHVPDVLGYEIFIGFYTTEWILIRAYRDLVRGVYLEASPSEAVVSLFRYTRGYRLLTSRNKAGNDP